MDTTTSKSSQSARSAPHYVDPVIALLIPKPRMTFIEKFKKNTDETQDKGCCLRFDNTCCSMLGRWWNVRYQCQRGIVHFVEKPLFHIAIIVLVLIDCLLVTAELLIDFIKLKKPCGPKLVGHTTPHDAKENHQLELVVEILHYSSLALLAVFLVEVLIKVYAFGRYWWDFRERKMEWLDAIIVIVSFALDLALMHQGEIFAEIFLLFISLRLWRFIRVVNSVAQTIRSQDENKKKRLATTYHDMIEILLTVSEKKTIVMSEVGREKTPENFDKILEKFEEIDRSCRAILEHCPHPSSFNAIADIAHHLQEAMDKLRLTSLTMNLPVSKNIDN